jgi:hypothetical protein
MGYLHYASDPQRVRIPDYELAHLKAVAVTKLRRNESFTLSWVHQSGPPGRTTIWMQPSIPLRFEFDCAESIPLDPLLLRKIADEANSARGVAIEADNVVDGTPVAAAHRALVAV